METLTWKPFHFYNASLTAKLVNLPEFMIVSIESNAFACLVQARGFEPPRLMGEQENKTTSDKNEDEYSIIAVHYKPSECRDG